MGSIPTRSTNHLPVYGLTGIFLIGETMIPIRVISGKYYNKVWPTELFIPPQIGHHIESTDRSMMCKITSITHAQDYIILVLEA